MERFVCKIDELLDKILGECVPGHYPVLHQLLEGTQHRDQLLDISIIGELARFHGFHQTADAFKLEKLDGKGRVFGGEEQVIDGLGACVLAFGFEVIIGIHGSYRRRECDTEDVTVPELASVVFSDVAKLLPAPSRCGRGVDIPEGIAVRSADVPLGADITDDGGEGEVLCHI